MSAINKPAATLLFVVCLGCMGAASLKAEEKFDLSLLENQTQVNRQDAEIFNGDSDILPGKYSFKILINDQEVAEQDVVFRLYHGRSEPLFACRDLQEWGVHIDRCPRAENFLSAWVHDAKFDIDLSENRLALTLPQQAWSKPNLYDIAPGWRWDNGINAAFVNYDLSAQRYQSSSVSNDFYGNLSSGVNLFGFRLRNDGYFSAPEMAHARYQSSSSWLAYDIDRLRSTLTVGDFYTSGSLFQGTTLRGVSLMTNMAMFSNTERSYVPAIIGSVSSNATVIVKQNGYVIATRQIPPGAFNINDVPVSSSAGDIDVTIIEASGKRQHFIQPFNTNSFQLPPHSLRYTLNLGESRQHNAQRLLEGTLLYGLNNTFTLLNGVQYAADYRNVATGMGANVRWLGGVSMLFNQSQTTRYQQQRTGSQLQLGLSRFLPLTDSYLYASATHRFNPYYQEFGYSPRSVGTGLAGGYRNKYSVQLSQNIKGMNLALNYNQEIDWLGRRYRNWQTNLNFNIRHATLLTSWSRRYSAGHAAENHLSVSISLPLGKERNHYLDMSHSSGNSHSSHLSLTGQMGEERSLSYSLGAAKSGSEYHYDASANYTSSQGVARTAWSRGRSTEQWQAGARGSVVLHSHGITLGQYLSESAAIVHTPHIADVRIENAQHVATDRWGNAVVPSLVPYYYNELAPTLDSRHIRTIKVDEVVHRLVPREGAIVAVELSASHQQQHYARITQTSGQPLPFGAILYDADNRNRGVLSAGGVISMDIYQLKWPLHISLADKQRCTIDRPVEKSAEKKIWHLICHS
ncbi:hypothetical protein B1H58_14790 [Pantoea alhagi]|uniref:PapC N-terminal domain-containing protein n=1 Tax=Pantoea alhagi TaxID=1891675 RepID=A0A1W6B7V7_9GAMM|nr:fimbria/pilus outer membrane usher protein [Pantoea alhagi]ARJ43170.1 hypothetical protein B1H58_14790 [Pantoea alhagi]